MAATENALPGQSGTATANELDQNKNPFTIADPAALVWSVSDTTNLSVTSNNDGTAKVTVSPTAVAGSYTVTFSDPAAPSITVTAGTVVVSLPVPVATTGSVDLGTFA